MDLSVNYLAVLVAGAASMVVGFLWYGPVFGKTWAKLMGWTAADREAAKKKSMGKSYALAFLGTLVTAYVLAYFVKSWAIIDAAGAFELVFWIWLGFIATTMLGPVLWEGKSWKLYFLNIFHYLIAFYIQALIVTYWV